MSTNQSYRGLPSLAGIAPLAGAMKPGLSVEECVRRLKRYHYAFKRLAQIFTARITAEPIYELKMGFSYHAHICAEHVSALRKRVGEMREPPLGLEATPHPALMVFDSPDGMSACTRRPRSNTPLQALTLLNDQAFVEFAQALSARVLKSKPKSNGELVELAFRLCLSRKPTMEEKARLTDLLNKEVAAFTKAPQEATAMAADKKYAMLDAKEFAAWTTVSRVLLNLDETITRE